MEFLPDTNIFSQIFKGNIAVKVFVESLPCAIDTIIYLENVQGSKSTLEKQRVQRYLANFPLLHCTPDISVCACRLVDTYSNTHGLLLADALIAATALEYDLTVITYNIKDFRFIAGLKSQLLTIPRI